MHISLLNLRSCRACEFESICLNMLLYGLNHLNGGRCRFYLNSFLKGTVKENERGFRLKGNHFSS